MARDYRDGQRIVQGHDRNKCGDCGRNFVGGLCPKCDTQVQSADAEVGNALMNSRVRCR